ncbi:acetate--CoA ligase family protein [Nocardioides houyundeii]|uniref:acetate--CoA ligase family protein n=1 Tax=Nocardioides houyundeii TaxID=2045452 RepID=UPI000DF44369|nr:acetate--CoA ligase family protein [Nocardioides houyundeii]
MSNHLEGLLSPRSIAIIGASARPASLAGRLERNLRAGDGERRIHLVNPRRDSVGDHVCHPDAESIGAPVDLACILVPAAQVVAAVEDCGRAGVRAAIVYSSGFGETGDEGRENELALKRVAEKYGVRLLGPNCQGFAVFSGEPLLATFSNAFSTGTFRPGAVAYVGQSGAIGGAVLDKARERGIGLSLWVSTGNQLDLDVIEVATAALARDDTRVVVIYLEGLSSGADLADLAHRARSLGKRVIVLHVGVSERAAQAIGSHTGAMLAPSKVLRTFALENGIAVVDDVDELLDMAMIASAPHRIKGPNLAVVTSSGGGGIIAADHAAAHDLDLPELPAWTQERLAEIVPAYGSTKNPIDVTTALFSGDLESLGDDVAEVCRRAAEPAEVDAVLVVLTMIVGERAERLSRALESLHADIGKPVYVAWLTSFAANVEGRARLIAAGTPVFGSVSSAITAVSADLRAGRQGAGLQQDPTIGVVDHSAGPVLDRESPTAAVEFLDRCGVAQPGWTFVETPEQAASLFSSDDSLRYAVKGLGSGLEHKTEANAVFLDVPSSEVAERCREIAQGPAKDRGLAGFLIQQMTDPGLEMLVSVARQGSDFPPLLVVGFGGVSTEVDPDVVTATLPMSDAHLRGLLTQLRGAALLGEFRGRPARDVDALVEVVRSVCRGLVADPQIQEIELNPVMVHPAGRGAVAVDALIL